MPCFDVPTMQELRTDWYPDKTNRTIARLKPAELAEIKRLINLRFDEHLANPDRNKVSVPINFPNPWPPCFAALWLACGKDEEQAAMILGNLFCRVAIERSEWWWYGNAPVPSWHPRMFRIGPKPVGVRRQRVRA